MSDTTVSNVYAIMGLFYGDEGKGATVDYLSRIYNASLVVRYNGGPQAAHHVVVKKNNNTESVFHCFAQFGSASLIPIQDDNDITIQRPVSTLLSHYTFVHIENLLRESEYLQKTYFKLHQHDIDPLNYLFIDKKCVLVTQWHKVTGQILEICRGEDRHGSTGMGVGQCALEYESIKLSGNDPLLHCLTIGDALDPNHFLTKIEKHISERKTICQNIINEYKNLQKPKKFKFKHLSIQIQFKKDILKKVEDILIAYEKEITVDFLFKLHSDFVTKYKNNLVDSSELLGRYLIQKKTIIFEGAQGVLLDRNYGFFPYITKTSCQFNNCHDLLKSTGVEYNLHKIGVLRTYSHRHGAGPFVTELKESDPFVSTLPENHNSTNKWQGRFRLGYFDLPAIKYSVDILGDVDSLSLTHLDYFTNWIRNGNDWKICLSYEYKGDNRDIIEQYFDIQRFGPNNSRICVKSIKYNAKRINNDSKLSDLLKDCIPLHFMSIKETSPSKDIIPDISTKATMDLILLLKSKLGLLPTVISYGTSSKERTHDIDPFLHPTLIAKQ